MEVTRGSFWDAVRREYVGTPLLIVILVNMVIYLCDFRRRVLGEIREIRESIDRKPVISLVDVHANCNETVVVPGAALSVLATYQGNSTCQFNLFSDESESVDTIRHDITTSEAFIPVNGVSGPLYAKFVTSSDSDENSKCRIKILLPGEAGILSTINTQ